MNTIIRSKTSEILKDFKDKIKRQGSLCELKELKFNDGYLPPYSSEFIQQYYHLRFFPAYLLEYKLMYKWILDRDKISDLKICSFGCGNGVDYEGARCAVNEKKFDDLFSFLRNASKYSVKYNGYDIVKWSYPCFDSNGKFHLGDLLNQNFKGKLSDSNVLMFPKSIGEFPQRIFDKIKTEIKMTPINSKYFYLAVSGRESHVTEDFSRLDEIKTLLEAKGYKRLDTKNRLAPNSLKSLYSIDNGFIIPDSVVETIRKVNSLCDRDNCGRIYSPCGKLGRNVMLNDYMNYKIIEMVKE